MIDTTTGFEPHRQQLQTIAARLLGSPSEADDAVQQAWLHFSKHTTDEIENVGGWLTTIVVRVCLDMLRARRSRREALLADYRPPPETNTPEQETLRADSVGHALRLVVQTLTPAERVALIFHEMFEISFDELAPIVCRSSAAARQLASRARRRVQGAEFEAAAAAHEREVVDALLAASRDGDLEAVLRLLCPKVILGADARLAETERTTS